MFKETPDLYDIIYAFKNYAAEAAQIAAVVRGACPHARRVLDVGCGTGGHARYLAEEQGFEVDGVDLEPGLLEVARGKHRAGTYYLADMSDFALATRYDAVICLFSSIGYLVTLERVRRALECFRRHLEVGGVVVVEPWFEPGVLEDGWESRQVVEHEGRQVVRAARTEVEGRISRLWFDYRIETADGVREVAEVHELGLFTADELREAFAQAGLRAEYDPTGLTGRGLWVARVANGAQGG